MVEAGKKGVVWFTEADAAQSADPLSSYPTARHSAFFASPSARLTTTGQFSEGLTFGDIHQAIDLIFKTMNRYQKLILGSTIVGSVTMDPWQAVFRVAWISDEETWRTVMQRIQKTDRDRLNQLGELPS